MEIRVIFKILLTDNARRAHGLSEPLNSVDPGEGLFTFEAALPPPKGTIMHFWPPAVARAIDAKHGKQEFRKGAATQIAQRYLNWEVMEDVAWWEVDKDGRLSTVIECTGQESGPDVPCLDYEDLIDRDLLPKRDDETR